MESSQNCNGNTRSDTNSEESINDIETSDIRSDVPENCDMCNDDNINFSEACCVCQSAPIFYTLLPCRHACVCSSCIKLLDQCPMCRGYIGAYFRLGNRSEREPEEDIDQDTGPLTVWQALNQRLNEMLGFA